MAYPFRPSEDDEGLGPPPGLFRFRTRPRWRLPGGAMRWGVALVAVLLLFIIASIAKGIYADWLWFDSVDYTQVYRLRIVTRIWLFFAGMAVFLLFFGANALFALWASRQESTSAGPFAEIDPALRRLALVAGVALTLFVGVIFGTQAAGQWDSILLLINSEPFGISDPAFHQDIGFYVFQLPALNFIAGWALALVVVTAVAVIALYAVRVVLAGFGGPPRFARPHVSLLLVAVVGLFVWRYWLRHYQLVYSERGVTFGATYTDLHAQLPVTYVLMGFASFTALCILISIARGRLIALPIAATVLWVVAAIAGGLIYPSTVQRFQVEPNELQKERPYIARNIEATRAAYGLDRIEERPFPARSFVTADEIAANPDTIQNIRLWDTRPLLQTLSQLQAIRPLYDFLDVDIDRYVVDGEVRQVMLSARELNPEQLPEDAKGWVNRRLQFTHGYGVTMVPVNEVREEGLPELFIKDIPPTGKLAVDQPRIYYGEMADHYVVVKSNEEEFDYPVGEERATTTYEGAGGVRLGSFLRRFVYAWELTDTNLLISDALNDDSRLLYRRNIQDRVHEIAPFLRLDRDPYVVLADGQLFWVQDAYTTTDLYPYATRHGALNYIRNSVKVVVNAFDGAVTFYLVDADDPIARVYDNIYPDLFAPFDDMPALLRDHLRYPEDLFLAQAQLYLRYHIRDASVFFNNEDLWEIPMELFIDSEQPLEPYYVIMRLPGEAQEEFALILPFNPANRKNTVAWLAARSDGEQYGKLLAFRFPTENLIFGPSQVESRIDQDTTISQQISLWNRAGSQVLRGNLLMIPIGEGNLYVEPIYLQATASSLPELKRVVVANGNAIAMEINLQRSLEVVLGLAEASGPQEDAPTAVSPTPASTPAPGETPLPTPSPQPSVESFDDIGQLIRQANAAFEAAQEALREGDFAGYGEQIARLEQLLQRLVGLTPIEGQP